MEILKCQNVSKYFGKKKIIDDLSFEIESGEIYGFLGPNGAGKTTTIKMITGLLFLDSGDIFIKGESIQKNRYKALENVGAIVENPELYPYLTGFENLMQFARTLKNVKRHDIIEVINMVGLNNRIKDKVKKYSLGMKQRLGIAQALLHKPELLVLDEPTNGLDPAGIKEFRIMIKSLAKKRNMSVFVSSHILSEIEKLCSRVAIIDNGKLIEVSKIDKENNNYIIFSRYYAKEIEKYFESKKINVIRDKYTLRFVMDRKDIYSIIESLVDEKLVFEEIYQNKDNLENRFLDITGGEII